MDTELYVDIGLHHVDVACATNAFLQEACESLHHSRQTNLDGRPKVVAGEELMLYENLSSFLLGPLN